VRSVLLNFLALSAGLSRYSLLRAIVSALYLALRPDARAGELLLLLDLFDLCDLSSFCD
jgi:hypothetical protein